MPSQFSAIGFRVSSGESLASLASHVADRSTTISVAEGQYLQWAPPSGEQLWLQVKYSGDAMGMTPHFAGRSAMRIGIEARLPRETHTPLDGTFLAWLNPPADGSPGGETPFVFDCPDAAVHAPLALPAVVEAQIAAFAQQLTVYPSEAAYLRDQQAQGLAFSSTSFIPSGLVSPSGEPVDPPEPHALFNGHVLAAERRINTLTDEPFWWALVKTTGGTVDVVCDPELVTTAIEPGGVVSGWFWLSGRLQIEREAPGARRTGWFQRLTGR